MAVQSLSTVARDDLAKVFKDPRTLLAFEAIQKQVATVLPDSVNQAIDTADDALIAADDAQFDASSALSLASALQNPSYVTLSTSTTLNNERVLQGGTGVTLPVVAGTVTIVVNVVTALGYTPGDVANPLSQFAATTSAQLAGVLSDETGTGLVVFGTGPTISAPILSLKGYTVGTLPAAPPTGTVAFVTDATAPVWNAALVGGGAVVCKAFYNGAAWVAG